MKVTFQIILLTFVLWLIGFNQFKRYVNKLEEMDDLRKVQANVVLTGDNARIRRAFELLKDETAQKLFVSGVGTGVLVKEIASQVNFNIFLITDYENRIILGRSARNTIQNGTEVAAWIKANNIKSIRLITSNYHMPRSLLEIKSNIKDVEIIPHTVGVNDVKKEYFYLIKEYNKYLVANLLKVVT